MSSLRVYDHFGVFISIPSTFRAYSLIGFIIFFEYSHFYVSMMGVDRYTMHRTILAPMVISMNFMVIFYPFVHDFLCLILVLNANYGYFTKFSFFAGI